MKITVDFFSALLFVPFMIAALIEGFFGSIQQIASPGILLLEGGCWIASLLAITLAAIGVLKVAPMIPETDVDDFLRRSWGPTIFAISMIGGVFVCFIIKFQRVCPPNLFLSRWWLIVICTSVGVGLVSFTLTRQLFFYVLRMQIEKRR